MTLFSLKEIGERGFVVHDKDEYFVANEVDWRKLPQFSINPRDDIGALVNLKVSFAALGNSVFVSLESLAELGPTSGSTAAASSSAPSAVLDFATLPAKSLVVHEGNSLFVIPREATQKIEPILSGDARVLVNRGAVFAAIPTNAVPHGTFCVLVNFTGVTLT